MTLQARLALGLGALALGLGSVMPALAQPAPRAGTYVFQGPNGPTVLEADAAGRVFVPPSRPDLDVPAMPVPQVMNGGGFGLTGFDYYSESPTEKRTTREPRGYVLAPALVAPPRY